MILEYKIEVINLSLIPAPNNMQFSGNPAFYDAEETLLAKMGRDSWQLSSVVFMPEIYQAKYYFHRERKNRAVPW